MKQIYLTRGYVAQVSDEDFERINSRPWFAVVGLNIRAARQCRRQNIYMHHEVLGVDSKELKFQGLEVDHIDRDPLNNQRNNLRIVSHAENMRNTARHMNRVGYSFNYRSWSYIVYLDMPGKSRKYLGYRKTEEEAIKLLQEARNENN